MPVSLRITGLPTGCQRYLAVKAEPGIFVPTSAEPERRSLDVNFDVDVKIAIDLGVISAAAASAWVFRMISKLGGNPQIYIDGHHTRIEEADIAKNLECTFNRQNNQENTEGTFH